jgi:hypothetical protein
MGGIPPWLKSQFENGNLELARRFAIELLGGKPYSRATLSECYYSLPSNGEKKEVSELWIDGLWARIENLSPKQWRHATGGDRAFVDFVYGFWGKDV